MYGMSKEKEANNLDLTNSLSNKDKELATDFAEFLRYRKEFREFLKQKEEIKDAIPVSVFNNNKLAPLETVVKFLREELDHTYKQIGKLLNRKEGPIGITYRNAKAKFSGRLDTSSSEKIPISIFKDSSLSVFETIVVYLKDKREMKFARIALLLNRKYRTVWTVYSRAKNAR